MKLWLQSQCWIACFWLGLWCSCCWWSSCYSPSASTKAFGQVFSADVFDEVLATVPVLDFMHLVRSLVLMLLMKFLLQSQCWTSCIWSGLWYWCCWWSSCYSPSVGLHAFGHVSGADVADEVLVTVPGGGSSSSVGANQQWHQSGFHLPYLRPTVWEEAAVPAPHTVTQWTQPHHRELQWSLQAVLKYNQQCSQSSAISLQNLLTIFDGYLLLLFCILFYSTVYILYSWQI